MAKFPNASQMKTINSCKSLNYSRPSAKRLKCAQPALAGNGQFLLFGKRAPSRIFSASDWMQAGQLIWNQFECFAAFLGVQVHSLFAALRTIYWRAVTIANASIYFVSKRENHPIFRKMSSRRKMATVNCMFAPKHKCTWKFQKWISLSHAACYPNVIELYSHSHTPQRERILMLGSPPHELTPLCCTRKRRS